jgi:hypothetical protein
VRPSPTPPWFTVGGWLFAVVGLLITGFLMIRSDNRRLDDIERRIAKLGQP